MRPTIYVADIAKHEGQEVVLHGWLHNRRSSGKLHFLQVRDGTGFIQCVVFKGNVTPEVFHEADHVPQETSLTVTGTVKKDPRSPIGYELDVKELAVQARPSREFPLGHKEHGVAFLMEQRHLWLRSQRQQVILRVRHTVERAIRDFFDGNGFTLVDAPIFTPSACEGTSTLFEVPYFDLGKAYLTQSGQLYMEAAAMALGKAYCFGPTFRAEKSKTRRHLTEFWMVEPEVAWNDSDANMRLQEEFVSYIVARCLARRKPELVELERDTKPLERVQLPFPRISYSAAVEKLQSLGSDMVWGRDLGGDEETLLAQQFDRPVLVHDYPKQVKAFDMKENPADPRTVLNNDMLAPEGYGEIIGGSQREDDYDKLLSRIRAEGLPEDAYGWYLDLRKYGTFVHAGFGLGVERTVSWICGIPHVREAIAFPRTLYKLWP